MNCEPKAAYAVGVALPLLEVARRRTDFSTVCGCLEPYRSVGRPADR